MGYLPPEAYSRNSQDWMGDIFAFGVALWVIITGSCPTDGFNFPFVSV